MDDGVVVCMASAVKHPLVLVAGTMAYGPWSMAHGLLPEAMYTGGSNWRLAAATWLQAATAACGPTCPLAHPPLGRLGRAARIRARRLRPTYLQTYLLASKLQLV